MSSGRFGAHVKRIRSFLWLYLYYYLLLRPLYYLLGVYRIYIETPKSFTFRGRAYKYFHHWYGGTYLIERIVEVPIIWDIVRSHSRERILEVGNCLYNFFPCCHDVVDKYDTTEGVINVDVVDYRPSQPYDLIVSISTLEHVGWDEKPRDPGKALAAIENLATCLAPGGEMVITWPLGYNTGMDRLFKDGKIRFTETYYMKRITHYSNRWKQADWSEVCEAKYGSPFRSGNALVIGFLKRGEDGELLGSGAGMDGASKSQGT